MTVYISDKIAQRLKDIADREKRKPSEQLEILIDQYERKANGKD